MDLKNLLVAPTFGYTKGSHIPYKPTFKEVIIEWFDSINFLKDRARLIPFTFVLFHAVTFVMAIIYFANYFSIISFLFVIACVLFLATVYNTIWFHRYCSHAAFSFTNKIFAQLLAWTNPIFFREESYALPHMIHHRYSDKPGDPYGPHLGWLGSYLGTESQQKFNRNINAAAFELMKKSMSHIPISFNSFDRFIKWGSMERVSIFLLRMSVAQLFWSIVTCVIGGIPFLFAWYTAVFIFIYLLRDFNWWGHGGNFRKTKKYGWEFDESSTALNQRFYGYIAGEWHDNHHCFPMSANTGFLPSQMDLAFKLIQSFHKLGIVNSYFNAIEKFYELHFKPMGETERQMKINIEQEESMVSKSVG